MYNFTMEVGLGCDAARQVVQDYVEQRLAADYNAYLGITFLTKGELHGWTCNEGELPLQNDCWLI